MKPWRNETANGSYVLYLGESAPAFMNTSRPRWKIADGGMFCSNAQRSMAVFQASSFSPDRLLVDDESAKIACSTNLYGPAGSTGFVSTDFQIICLSDEPPPTPPPTDTVPSSPPSALLLPVPSVAMSAATQLPLVSFAAVFSALLCLLIVVGEV